MVRSSVLDFLGYQTEITFFIELILVGFQIFIKAVKNEERIEHALISFKFGGFEENGLIFLQGKSRPFWTPLGPPGNGGGFTGHQIEVQKEKEERSSVLDDVVFQQFKPTRVEKGDDVISVGDGEKGDGMGPFSEKQTSSSSFGLGSSGDCDFGTSTTSSVIGSSHVGKVGTSTVNDVPGSRKRNLFGGMPYLIQQLQTLYFI